MYEFDKETGELVIDNKTFIVDEFDDEMILFEPDLKDIQGLNFIVSDFPDILQIDIQSEDGFGTYLFYDLEISKSDNIIIFTFSCNQPNKYWEGKYGLSTFLGGLSDIINDSPDVNVENINIDGDYKEIGVSFTSNIDFNISESIQEYTDRLNQFIKQTERVLSGVVWRIEYESNEDLFCTDLLYPLLRKMGFTDVRYTHGIREFGKDFTFSELTRFGNLRHFGLQAKAGNIKGSVNSQIDEIIGQLDDAFSMPYFEISANEDRRISTFIVAISGNFTENAKEKISNKIPNYFKGCIYFIDKDKILELIDKYWK